MSQPTDPGPEGPDDARIDAIARGAFARRVDPGGAGPPDGAPSIDPARLLAWRAGALPPEEAERIEAALADDPEARALLRELAEPTPAFLQQWAIRESRRAMGRTATRWVAPIAGLALAAAVVVFALLPGRIEPPAYRIDAVRGMHAPIRGAEGPAPDRAVVDPESVLVLALAPDAPRATAPPALAFAQSPDGRLRAVDASALSAGEGGALRFEAPVVDLFGRSFGARTLWIALGGEGVTVDALRALDGAPLHDAREAVGGVRWLAVELMYREGVR